MLRPAPVAAVLLMVFLFAAARAGEIWLQPERTTATPGAVLAITAFLGEGFTVGSSGLPAGGVGSFRGWLDDAALEVRLPAAADGSGWRIETVFPRPGVAVLGLSTKATRLVVPSGEILTHLRSLHLSPETVLASPDSPPPWVEDRTVHAKAFVRVGEPVPGERGWSRELGLPLELIPERDPTSLRRSEALRVRLLRRGEPVSQVALAFLSERSTREHVVMTDGEGLGAAVLDLPGPWLVVAADLRASAGSEAWDCQLATLRLEVSP